MAHEQFQADLDVQSLSTVRANNVNDVGITLLKTTSQPGGSKCIAGWNFVLPLEGFKSHPSTLSMEPAMLFGQVTYNKVLASITALSLIQKKDRTNILLTLEST